MARTRSVPLLSAREKMPFEITPVFLHLTYANQPEQIAAGPVDDAPVSNAPAQ